MRTSGAIVRYRALLVMAAAAMVTRLSLDLPTEFGESGSDP
jgi:hypothetical protein